MIKTFSAERTVDAPADLIYARLADIGRHPEWDETAARAEPTGDRDPAAVGGEWKVAERFSLMHATSGTLEEPEKRATGLSKRTLTELEPTTRVAWKTTTVPNLGLHSTTTWTLLPEGRSTRVTVEVAVSVPMLVEKVGKAVFRHLDEKFEIQLGVGVDALKAEAEAEASRLVVAV